MFLGIIDNEIYPYSYLLFKRRRIKSICLAKYHKFKRSLKSNSILNLNKEKEIKTKRFILLKKLIEQRKKSSIKIQSVIRKYLLHKKFKKFLFLKELIEKRLKSIILIQRQFKTFLSYKHFKKLLENEALFFYKFPIDLIDKLCLVTNSEKLKEMYYNNKLNLSMEIKSHKINLNFKYSKYLDSYYIPIKKIKLFKKQILINFKINNEKILDPRYSILNDSNGNFYNIITPKMIYRKNKDKSFIQKNNDDKTWEKLFILKNRKRSFSFDASSISSKTDISKELNKNYQQNNYSNFKEKNQIHSILKHNNSVNKKFQIPKKKVSFKSKIEFYN